MKKYFFTLCFSMIAIIANSQSHVNFDQDRVNTVVSRPRNGQVSERSNHLCFEGISIEGKPEAFISKLKSKGYQVGDHFKKDGIEMLIRVNRDELRPTVNEVEINYYFPDNNNGTKLYQKYVDDITKSLNSIDNIRCNQVQDDGYFHSVYEIFDNNIKRGEINFSNWDSPKIDAANIISITYRDHTNSLQNKICDYPEMPSDWYDFSNLLTGNDSKCYLSIAGNDLFMKFHKGTSQSNKIIRGSDKETMLLILKMKNSDSRKKAWFDALVNYVNRGIDPRPDYFRVIHNDLEPFTRELSAAIQKQQQNTNTVNTQNIFLNWLRSKIFSKEEQERFRNVGISDDIQNAMLKAVIGVAAGDGKYHCSCGQSFSNYADLRSHENAVHDY